MVVYLLERESTVGKNLKGELIRSQYLDALNNLLIEPLNDRILRVQFFKAFYFTQNVVTLFTLLYISASFHIQFS